MCPPPSPDRAFVDVPELPPPGGKDSDEMIAVRMQYDEYKRLVNGHSLSVKVETEFLRHIDDLGARFHALSS